MTGLTSEQVDRLVLDIYAHADLDPTRRQAVGPYRSVLLVLLYLRHNLAQALLAELFDRSQPTVSRLIGRLTPAITQLLTPNAEQVAARESRNGSAGTTTAACTQRSDTRHQPNTNQRPPLTATPAQPELVTV